LFKGHSCSSHINIPFFDFVYLILTEKLILEQALNWSEAVPKIKIVILSEVKNLIFFFSSQKIKKEILRPQDDKERQIYKNFGTLSKLVLTSEDIFWFCFLEVTLKLL
jgi:hypothetical protein